MLLGHSIWPQRALEAPKARIVLLHGMGGTGALWRPIAASLENEYALLAPDQRGHGKSVILTHAGDRTPPSYTPLEYGRDIIETMDNLHFHPAVLVGHSMGVRTACAAAYLKPEWVQGLVLIDLGFSGVAGGGLGEGLAHFLRLLPQEFLTRAEAREFMTKNCPDPSIAQYLMAVSVRKAGSEEIRFPFDHAALIQTIQAARDASVRTWVEKLGAMGKKILILRGAQSLVWSHEEFEQEKAAFARFSSIQFEEFEGAGHGLPFEKRTEFIERLVEFISTL